MSITIEPATPADAEALVRIQVTAFHSDSDRYPGIEPGGPPGYESVEHMLRNIEQHICYKIMDGEQPIGVMVIIAPGQGHVHLDVIAIDPAYHDRGIGSQAMRFFEQTHPAERWTLDTPAWAVRNHHFYQKLGYVKVGETVFPDVTLFAYEKR